jgi:hypothetical protein
MENQHQKITGYRDLSQQEIAAMNRMKSLGRSIEAQIEQLEADELTDKRWIAIGKTDLQKGIMALVRAIAKPESF